LNNQKENKEKQDCKPAEKFSGPSRDETENLALPKLRIRGRKNSVATELKTTNSAQKGADSIK